MIGTARRRVLRSGSSLWATTTYGRSVPYAPLEGDATADVVVVGAGISGALVTHELTRRGYAVVVLDRRVPCTGSTLASTALLQFEIDVPMSVLGTRIGLTNAKRAWRRSVAAVRTLARLVAKERIRCEWSARQSLYLAGDKYGARALRIESDARRVAGISGVFVDARTLGERFAIDRTGALLSDGCAVANPVQLTAGLLRRGAARGAKIYSGADVQTVNAGRRGVELGLANGCVVNAKHVVFCTGYEMLPAIPRAGHLIKSTWAIATKPVENLPAWMRSTLVWEASDPYLYLRTTADGRVVAGGRDEKSATRHRDRRALFSKAMGIVKQVEALLPRTELKVSHRWAGAFGESPTGLPIIDRVLGAHNCYALAGFGGNGITHSVIGAEIITAMIAGERDPDANLFRAPR